jgi:ABC-2 type transport system ATP-binding protein
MAIAIPIILKTIDLTRNYENLVAVNKVNITVRKNIIYGLLGPNGAGKSTLIKMLITLLKPTSGDAFINGVSIVKNPRMIRAQIGYVPQNISADSGLTGYENLMFMAQLYSIPAKERKICVQEALDLMGLVKVEHNLITTYSGGMIRRLEIAQALLHKPKILFLDEPTTGLDIAVRSHLWDYLKIIKSKFNTTIIISTHDMEEADILCDEVTIMNQGKINITGTPQQLKNSLNLADATLADVFLKYSGNNLEQVVQYQSIVQQRKNYKRLG